MARVLMIEDNQHDVTIARLILATSFDFAYAATFQDALEQLSKETPDVVLLDLNLPDSNGMETLAQLAKQHPDIPIVVWSGAGDAADAIRHGADEFLLKDGTLLGVQSALASAIARHKFKSVKEDISALQKLTKSDNK